MDDLHSGLLVTYALLESTSEFHSVRILPMHNLNLQFRCRSRSSRSRAVAGTRGTDSRSVVLCNGMKELRGQRLCRAAKQAKRTLRGEGLTKQLVLATEGQTPNPSFGWAEQA
jgi:hypothetical protein